MLQNNAGTLHYFDASAASNVGPAISGENALVLDTKVVFVPNPNYYFAMTPIFAYVWRWPLWQAGGGRPGHPGHTHTRTHTHDSSIRMLPSPASPCG